MLNILVTGANSGIGLALCKQLCKDHGAKVFLGARNAERGAKAVADVKSVCDNNNEEETASVELLVIDVASDESVQAAAKTLQNKGVTLQAIVNNAGTGLAHEGGVSDDDIMNVNLYGPKRVVEAFLPLLDPAGSKIVNTGSGAGPIYVNSQSPDQKRVLCNPNISWDEIDALAKEGPDPSASASSGWKNFGPYGLSKALIYCYTMYTARTLAEKNVVCLCLSPGFIATGIVPSEMHSSAKPAEEGTISLKYCLLEATMENNGWFYGSDAKRSPPYFLRNPGEPVYDGNLPNF